MRLDGHDSDFIVIGENIHTTRVYLRSGVHVTTPPGGIESVRFVNANGDECFLPISDEVRQ